MSTKEASIASETAIRTNIGIVREYVEISGGTGAAHYASDYDEVAGITGGVRSARPCSAPFPTSCSTTARCRR